MGFHRALFRCLIITPLHTETEWRLLSTADVELDTFLTVSVPGTVPGTFAVGIDICHTQIIAMVP